MSGFAKIRNGIKRHIEGKDGVKKFMPPAELGIYVFLHLYCDYDTGIYRGSAGSIAGTMGCPRSTVRDALHRLRDRQFINFKSEQGVGAAYDIFIDKFEPTFGRHFGYRLNAWTNKDLPVAAYEKIEDDRQLDDGSPTVPRALNNGSPPVSQTPRLPNSQTEQTSSVVGVGESSRPPESTVKVPQQEESPAERLANHFWNKLGKLSRYSNAATVRSWTGLCAKLLDGRSYDVVASVMTWALEESAFWTVRIVGAIHLLRYNDDQAGRSSFIEQPHPSCFLDSSS